MSGDQSQEKGQQSEEDDEMSFEQYLVYSARHNEIADV